MILCGLSALIASWLQREHASMLLWQILLLYVQQVTRCTELFCLFLPCIVVIFPQNLKTAFPERQMWTFNEVIDVVLLSALCSSLCSFLLCIYRSYVVHGKIPADDSLNSRKKERKSYSADLGYGNQSKALICSWTFCPIQSSFCTAECQLYSWIHLSVLPGLYALEMKMIAHE